MGLVTRTRSRETDLGSGTGTHGVDCNGVGVWLVSGSWSNVYSEAITDEVNEPRICSPLRTSKYVYNRKSTVTHKPKSFSNSGIGTDGQLYRYHGTNCVGNQTPSDRMTSMFSPPPGPDLSAIAVALQRMQPDISNMIGTNIIEFLADIEESFTIIPQLFKSFGRLANVHQNAKQFAKNSGISYLTVEFGTLPLIQDLSRLINLLDSIDAFIDRWNKAADNRTVWNKHATLDSSSDNYSEPDHDPGSTAYVSSSDFQDVAHRQISSRLSFYYVPLRIPVASRPRLIAESLGLTKPVSSTWAAIPFSWLIDYFLHVDTWLKSIEPSFDSLLRIDIIDACYSIKCDCSGTSNRYTNLQWGGAVNDLSCSETVSYYVRYPIPAATVRSLLATNIGFQLDYPRKRQLVNSVAFTLTKLK